jgi:DUF4097 and DUF4098 domain-containing protein YvlB
MLCNNIISGAQNMLPRIVLIFFFLVPTLKAQELPKASTSDPKAPYVEREEKQFNFYPGGKIAISVEVPGSLKIVGWKKGSVRMEAENIVYYDTEEKAKELLKKSPIRVRHTQTSVTISTSKPTVPDEVMEMNLTVFVPGDRTDIKAALYRGDCSVESVNGWVEISILDGSLDAKDMSGYFSGDTQRGDLIVEMSGIRWRGYEFAAKTQMGSIQLRLPSKYSAALQLETRNGEISVDYPPQEVDGEVVPPEIIINKTAQSLKATIGDGGTAIKLATNSGDISLLEIKE